MTKPPPGAGNIATRLPLWVAIRVCALAAVTTPTSVPTQRIALQIIERHGLPLSLK
jgi:hypothetical protein